MFEIFDVCPQVQDVFEDDRNRSCQHGGQVVLQRGANQVFRAQEREGVQEVLLVGQVPQVQAPEAGLPQGQPLLLSWLAPLPLRRALCPLSVYTYGIEFDHFEGAVYKKSKFSQIQGLKFGGRGHQGCWGESARAHQAVEGGEREWLQCCHLSKSDTETCRFIYF